AHHARDRVFGERRGAVPRQHLVRGVRQITLRIDQRAIEIEDDELTHRSTWRMTSGFPTPSRAPPEIPATRYSRRGFSRYAPPSDCSRRRTPARPAASAGPPADRPGGESFCGPAPGPPSL